MPISANEAGRPASSIAGSPSEQFKRVNCAYPKGKYGRSSTQKRLSLFGIRCSTGCWRSASMQVTVRRLRAQGCVRVAVCRNCWHKLTDNKQGGGGSAAPLSPVLITRNAPFSVRTIALSRNASLPVSRLHAERRAI